MTDGTRPPILASVTDAASVPAPPDPVSDDPAVAIGPPTGEQPEQDPIEEGAPADGPDEAPPGAGEAVAAPVTAGPNDQVVTVHTDDNGCGIVNVGVLLAHVLGVDADGIGDGSVGVSEAAVGITRLSVSDGPPNTDVSLTVHLPN